MCIERELKEKQLWLVYPQEGIRVVSLCVHIYVGGSQIRMAIRLWCQVYPIAIHWKKRKKRKEIFSSFETFLTQEEKKIGWNVPYRFSIYRGRSNVHVGTIAIHGTGLWLGGVRAEEGEKERTSNIIKENISRRWEREPSLAEIKVERGKKVSPYVFCYFFWFFSQPKMNRCCCSVKPTGFSYYSYIYMYK